MEEILKHFPSLTERQRAQFQALPGLYTEWNSKINVISRKDIENLMLHHVLHALSIAKVVQLKPMAAVIDVGTGGGFPGVPLAILFPQARFTLVDSIGKKIKVVEDIARQLGLDNVEARQTRVEQVRERFDFVVSRAVTDFPQFVKWTRGLVSTVNMHPLHNGILYLKGGDLTQELKPFAHKARVFSISDYFEEPYFEEKKIIYLPVR